MRIGFSAVVKGSQSHMVFLDTPLHVDAVTSLAQVPEEIVVQKQPLLQQSCLVSSFGQHEICNRAYGRTRS
jgi:hypothetical protein